jgi:sterol carrier protein 2
VFDGLDKALQEGGSALVKRVNGVFLFEVTNGPGGKNQAWTLDLKTGEVGKVHLGAQGTPGVTLTMSDETVEQLFGGKINAQNAFMQGKLKIKGDMGLATKLGEVIKSKARL